MQSSAMTLSHKKLHSRSLKTLDQRKAEPVSEGRSLIGRRKYDPVTFSLTLTCELDICTKGAAHP